MLDCGLVRIEIVSDVCDRFMSRGIFIFVICKYYWLLLFINIYLILKLLDEIFCVNREKIRRKDY